ncbi:MAG TPA: type 1 periplasmic binding fold superfamily protein [Flavobacteriaceae bacterium]|nr:type 1 periplasmic binding fold superfamily protein [Flavobacteriaceae bacterium]
MIDLIKTKPVAMILIFFGAVACTDPEIPEIINQEEVITTILVRLTPENGGETAVLSYRDLDGNGPNAPVLETDQLQANTEYSGEIVLLNETLNPAEIVTEEVAEEGTDHQFFYATTAAMNLQYADADENGNPIGILFNLQTGNPSSGSLTIVLRHEPNKLAEGVQNGEIENAGGETDLSVTFGITVE